MKFEYGLLSDKRNEEIEKMEIVDPFGEYDVPRISFKNIRVTKNEDESYVFSHLIGGPHYYDAHPNEAYYLFICKDKYHFILLYKGDYIKDIVHEWNPRIQNITIKIRKNNELSEQDIYALVHAFKVEVKSGYHGKDDCIKFRIIYDNKLMIEEF